MEKALKVLTDMHNIYKRDPRIKQALEEVKEAMKPKTCEWHLADDDWNIWTGQCGAEWHLTDGTPNENKMHFCHGCGSKLIQIDTVEDDEDDEPKDNA